MDGKKVLVVDDDPALVRLVKRALSEVGHHVVTAANGQEALRLFYDQRPDLVILDVVMSGLNGWETCRSIRQMSNVPIIMLTAQGSDADMLRGLDYGADDYVVKPFNLDVLLARTRAVLRRAEQPALKDSAPSYHDAYLTIDLNDRRVLVNNVPIKLTATEFKLLAYLVRNADRVLTFTQILENVWGWEYRDSIDYVHVYVSHLRQKLEQDPRHPEYLITEHGVGYRFEKRAA
ncbi:MAG: response regulator transcription factor [Anaerolineae bacterium]